MDSHISSLSFIVVFLRALYLINLTRDTLFKIFVKKIILYRFPDSSILLGEMMMLQSPSVHGPLYYCAKSEQLMEPVTKFPILLTF